MIPGGYILFARKTLESKIMEAPHLTFKLWGWMLLKATFKTNWKFQAGKFETSIKEMQKAMTYFVGNRKEKPSIAQIRTAYSFLTKNSMISTAKHTGGLVITICNYDKYQDPTNYETHGETHSETHRQKKPKKIPQSGTSENTSETHTTRTRKPAVVANLHASDQPRKTDPIAHPYNNKNEYTTDNSNISITKILEGVPEQEEGETDFERDRRVFFEALAGVKTFQLFDDNAGRKDKSLIKLFHTQTPLPWKYTERLEILNNRGAGIYLCVNETNGKGRKTTDVVRVRSVFADFDGVNLPDSFDESPSMIVESSPGKYHVYYFTNDTPLAGFAQIQKAMAYKFNSDPVVHDLPRVMRVPGFFHNKKEPFLSRIISYTGNVFEFGLLQELFPPKPVRQWSALKYQAPSDPNAKFNGPYGASQGGRNCHLSTRIGGMLKRGLSWPEIENETFKEASACSPPLSDSETRAILKSMRRYA